MQDAMQSGHEEELNLRLWVVRALPGLGLVVGIAAGALLIRQASGLPALGPLVVAMALGIGMRAAVGPLPAAAAGIGLSVRPLLRFAIVLLGVQITPGQVLGLGLGGMAALAVTLACTFLFTTAAGRVLGVEPGLTELIAAGTSVCGASAIIACNAVTRARDEDVAYAVACVTVCGTMAMIAYPLLAAPLGLLPEAYGLWAGATIHEVAQVVAAAFAQGDAAGHAGTVAKLGRVMMLAPLILTLGALAARRRHGGPAGRTAMPWFVLGFAAAVMLHPLLGLPDTLRQAIAAITTFLLTMALAAMGVQTDVGQLWRRGLRPLLLGALATVFIAVFGLIAVRITG